MNQPRKPIFGFLWPTADPDAPVDEAYRQVRWVRITPRGPVRVAMLVVGTVLTVSALGTVVLAGLSTDLSALTVVGGAVCASLLALCLRGWVVGTYVNDAGIRIETTFRRVTVPWAAVAAIDSIATRAPCLGLPIPLATRRSVVRMTGAEESLPTHVFATSPDLWLRPEAFDMARLRLAHWADGHRATGR